MRSSLHAIYDIYILVVPGVAVPPRATKTVLSPWLAVDKDRVSHVLSHIV